MPSAAYLDTTILAEVSLKKGGDAGQIGDVLGEYEEITVSAYVLKEFRAGVLNDLVYFFNELLEADAAGGMFGVLNKIDQGGFRRYRQKIALQVCESLERTIPREMAFGMVLDRIRDELSELILDAWEEVHDLGTVIEPITCFDDRGPRYDEHSGRIEMPVCWPNPPPDGCCAAIRALAADVIDSTLDALKHEEKTESQQRFRALKSAQASSAAVTRHHCRCFGDFAVVLYAPDGAHVLSTNSADFPRLCQILGKEFRNPLARH